MHRDARRWGKIPNDKFPRLEGNARPVLNVVELALVGGRNVNPRGNLCRVDAVQRLANLLSKVEVLDCADHVMHSFGEVVLEFIGAGFMIMRDA